MTADSKLYKIGEFSQLAGITIRTVRYYEELGLLKPSENSPGGFRLYSEADYRRIKYVKRFRDLDFSLEEIQQMIDIPSQLSTSERATHSIELLKKQLTNVNNKIQVYNELKQKIENAIRSAGECVACDLPECDPECRIGDELI